MFFHYHLTGDRKSLPRPFAFTLGGKSRKAWDGMGDMEIVGDRVLIAKPN